MVYNSFIDATKKEGLEVIPAEGETFDPNFHQAVMQERIRKRIRHCLTRTSKRV